MTTELTVSFDAVWGCWIAYISDCPENSGTVGEGRTREDAIADYWDGIHNGKTARLLEPGDTEDGRWALYDGKNIRRFDSREDAVAYGEAHEYLI